MCRTLFIAVVFAFLNNTVAAQNYITLHEQCNYAGKQYTLGPGSYHTYQIKIDNDKLSSLQIPAGFKVTVFEHNDFEGKSNTYYSSSSCLEASWRNTVSSIIVESPGNIQQPGYGNDYITFYTDCYSKGYSQSLKPGTYSGSQLGSLKYAISSFIITGNLRVRVYLNNENMSGASVPFETSQTCFSNSYNDKIGSLIVEYKSSTPSYPVGGQGGNNNYATLYTDCNYNGNALRLMPGNYQGSQLGLMKYAIASLDLGSNLRARVYLDNEYLGGQSYLVEDDINCMTSNLRNRVGSVTIEEKYGSNPYNPPTSTESVIIYTDGNYKGQSVSLLPGTYRTMAEADGFPDNMLSSLIVPPGYRVVLYEFENFGGKSYTVTQSKTGFIISGWNDKTSSIAVYRD